MSLSTCIIPGHDLKYSNRLKWQHQPLLRPYAQQSVKKIGEVRWNEMKTWFELFRDDPSPPSLHLANRAVIFSQQVFSSFKLSVLIFSQSFLCLLYMNLVQRKLFWLEWIKEKKKRYPSTWTFSRRLTSLKRLKQAFNGKQSHRNRVPLFLFNFFRTIKSCFRLSNNLNVDVETCSILMSKFREPSTQSN